MGGDLEKYETKNNSSQSVFHANNEKVTRWADSFISIQAS